MNRREDETQKPTAPLLATCGRLNDGNMPERLAGLLTSGMWDQLAPDDRGAFTERGEVYDTPSGERIFRWLCRVYGDRDGDEELAKRRESIAKRTKIGKGGA